MPFRCPSCVLCFLSIAAARAGVPVAYQLPADGPLPRTYRVTLAVVDAQNPAWIVSQFAAGVARTVTDENGGKFVETWDGLDDNFMPVPPGRYAVKGIYMPAQKWAVDGEYHTVTPRFVAGASAWSPPADQWQTPEPFGGDPTGQPLGDVAVGPNGVAVFHYVYLENGLNDPLIDLNKPVGYGQFIRAFPSGGAAGGTSTCTDGQSVWSYSTDGGPKFVYRADQKPFGASAGANRNNVYRPDGWVTALAAWRDEKAGNSFVYVAQRGKFAERGKRDEVESDRDFADKVTAHEGEGGRVLAELPLPRPHGLAVHDGSLYALHAGNDKGEGFAVSAAAIEAGVPRLPWRRLFDVPTGVHPFALAVDSHGRLYLSDPDANKVYQFDAKGAMLLTIGRLAAQEPGAYDPLTLMSPGKLAAWTDRDGNDRLIVVEQAGPNLAAEWSADGKLLREFLSLQTKANDGYAVDPQDPDHLYIAGHRGWLTRFKVDPDRGTYAVDAVWPGVGADPEAPGFDHPRFVRAAGRQYLACARSYNVYRLEETPAGGGVGSRWLLSAAIVRKRIGTETRCYAWHDANGDGRVQPDEYLAHPLPLPGRLLRYHGEQWLDDLSLLAVNQDGRDLWRLAPSGFDGHGSPVFTPWQKVLADPVFEARAKGKADAIHGGNELDDRFSSDWAMADGSPEQGYYVQARGGKNFSANEGPQTKISRYVPDAQGGENGPGGYRLLWRTGRAALGHLAQPGEIYGAIHLHRPINGLLSVIDQSRCGVLLYTEDGLYVDTVFPDGRRFSPKTAGVYPQPGEFFAGDVYPDPARGKIYFALGKYTPMLYEAQGWSPAENPVRPLPTVQPAVEITAAQVANPPEVALSLRGGPGAARVARFSPALGGAAMDGSLAGWESCEPVRFQSDAQHTVEVRCLYDPEHLYLRWHARLGAAFDAKPLRPIERLFTHDRLADTLSFYVQGDPAAGASRQPGGRGESRLDGRPGDVRFVFGLFKDGDETKPVAVGMYPKWAGPGPATPQTYATPVNKVTFEHVGPAAGVKLGSKLDDDAKGYVLVAEIPRAAIPGLPSFSGESRTTVDFEATFAGHDKFWWADRDGSASRETYDEPTEARLYPGAWAPAQFEGLEKGVVVRHWLVCGPWGGPGAERFSPDPRAAMKEAVRTFAEAAKYPPDAGFDPAAVYTGDLVRGYWPDPGQVKWKETAVADLDTRVILGPSAQVWFGTTWVRAPADTEVEFQFQGHPQTYLRFALNGQVVYAGDMKPPDGDKDSGKPVASRKLTLRQGWNQVTFRSYCVGYPPFRAGLVLAGPAEKLWGLRLSSQPPARHEEE